MAGRGTFNIANAPNAGFRGGTMVFTPGWENIILTQAVPTMDKIGRFAYNRARQLAPVGTRPRTKKNAPGATRAGVRYQVDPETAITYVNAGAQGVSGSWDARFSEFGTGRRGAASGDFEGFESAFKYDKSWPGRAAQPFIRPAALEALEAFRKGLI